MNGILLRTFQIKDELTKMERVVADALLAEPNAIIMRSITEYASYISSSTATVTRFCKRLGISGFSELRLLVANSINNEISSLRKDNEKFNLEAANSVEEILNAVTCNAISSIEELHKIVNSSIIQKAVDIILSSRNILLTGIGASALVATDLHQKLTRLGILSHFDLDLDLQKVQLSSFDESDLVIAFSYSGMKEDVHKICKLAKKKKARIIAVTKLGNTPISSIADLHIPVVPSEALLREGATVSRLQMLVVVDYIFQYLIHKESGSFETIMETWTNVSNLTEGRDE